MAIWLCIDAIEEMVAGRRFRFERGGHPVEIYARTNVLVLPAHSHARYSIERTGWSRARLRLHPKNDSQESGSLDKELIQ